MKNNQKVLQLHPHLSKLIDSLCFELAVNVPDENSLCLLEIMSMRRKSEITKQELRELYVGWLQSKNIFDLFSAKQLRLFQKSQLISNVEVAQHLHINTINTTLEILHEVYNSLLKENSKILHISRRIKETEDLFSYLDSEGNIHLRMSQLFFLFIAIQVHNNSSISCNYDNFKPLFKAKNKEICQIQGMVSLRWFKNYFLAAENNQNPRQILFILKDIQKNIRFNEGKRKKNLQNRLPNLLDEAFIRWRTGPRFSGLFESKKKKLQIYHRVFQQNQEIFFFNGGKNDSTLSENYFIRKYGEDYVKSLEIDTSLLKEFYQILKAIMNEYLSTISLKQDPNNRHIKSNLAHSHTAYMASNVRVSNHHNSNSNHSSMFNHKLNQSYQQSNKYSNTKSKDRTPKKLLKGNETRRLNITPTNKNYSPFINRQFGSTQRSLSKNRNDLTPNKSMNNYTSSLYMGNNSLQVYKNSKKQGLEKDSFYQKLFFFKNKRVESFDIVIKRLRGK